jgi:MFS family permease
MTGRPLRFRGPLAESYPAAVCLVVFALIPYLALSSAFTPLLPILSKSLHMSDQALSLTSGMANAAYAFGTVLAVQLAVHLRGRRLLFLDAVMALLGSVLAASAQTAGLFIAGHVLQGFATSLMLIAAVPPLVIRWPADKMPITAVIMNMCIFGAVAVGPVIGGVQSAAGDWRPLFWIVAGISALALLFVVLTFEDQEPQDRSAPWDWVAMTLASTGCAAAFFGASELQTHAFASPIVLVPLLGGLALLLALVVFEYHVKNPLMPVRQAASTFPVAGIVVAMCAGAASVAVIELAQTALKSEDPTHVAMLFLPEFGAAAAIAVVFGLLFRTRYIPVLAFGGVLVLSVGAAVLSGVTKGSDALVLVGSGLVGLGVGASVSPALFIAGFSLLSTQLQRVFALVELLRGVAAFMVAPVILHISMTVGSSPSAGIRPAAWVCCAIAAGGGLFAIALFLLGRARLQRPDLEPWDSGDEPAWYSPPLLAGVRGERHAPVAAGARD